MPMPKKVIKAAKPIDYYELARRDTREWALRRKRDILRSARLQADRGDDPHGILEEIVAKVGALKTPMGGEEWRLWNLQNIAAQEAADAGVELKTVLAMYVGSKEHDAHEAEIQTRYRECRRKIRDEKADPKATIEAAMTPLSRVDRWIFVEAAERDNFGR